LKCYPSSCIKKTKILKFKNKSAYEM